MERSALCTDIVNKVPICHLVLSTLDPESWFLGQHPSSRTPWPSCPNSNHLLLEGWQGKEKTELTSLKPQNVLTADLLKGISYCEHCCQSLLNSLLDFVWCWLLCRLIPPVETHSCLLHLYLLKLWILAAPCSPYIYFTHWSLIIHSVWFSLSLVHILVWTVKITCYKLVECLCRGCKMRQTSANGAPAWWRTGRGNHQFGLSELRHT